ncbi:protein PF14_0175-like isoform X2 [Vespa mandarinia]|uniref:protein PF14_0175-like isoform X1 n=1 Tax=Vespa mandarinia TaxID=7446 RepID=UPI0016079A3A|nr:protein PF14_0175-like isoform X1 [Vespa mandarinia]XP_035732418.1 protein PF14_0175-like isoform X2 [Vespa mandarinia]
MNYGGNISDWHQYNSVQTNINEVTSTDHNVNANRLAFMSSGNPSSLNALNTEGYKKYQNEPSFSSRHFPPMNNISNGSNNSDNFAIPSMVQMQSYIGQYGPMVNRNSVMDNVKAPVDMRNGSMNTFNDDYRYRNSHMALPGQNSHLNGSNININTSATSMGSRSNSMCATSSVRQGPSSFIPCKALCCNPNTNIGYQQWDKFGTYQSNTPYRENMRLPGYQAENRQYSDHNFRKDNFDNKEMLNSIISNTDHRRNFPEYKYPNKDPTMSRGCPAPSGMVQNYPIQNYNYPTECQKYAYPMKEYPKPNNMSLQDATVFKHPEQNYIAQQKYNTKQGQYTTGNVLTKTVPTSNVSVDITSSTQNSYYTAQFIRNVSTEFPHTCQKTFDNPQQVATMQPTPMHNTSSRYHSYQQKIAMQRSSMENHLRELTRIPGYQSHPKYKESVLRYREILKLQQSHGYPMAVQHPLRIPSTSVNAIPSINLQFDQNGVLINSDGFPKTQHTLNSDSKHLEKQGKEQDLCASDLSNEDNLHSEQSVNHSQKEHSSSLYPNSFPNQDQLLIHKCSEQTEFKIQKSTENADTMTEQHKTSKDFADKPDLDVRQFLANWDASEDEDDSNSNLPDVVLSNSTPLVVVEYENVDSTSKIPHDVNVNKENMTSSKKHDKITEEYSQSLNSSPHNTEVLKNLNECTNKDITKSGNIIHCITNGTDDIPTIHIVDNVQINNILEVSNDQIIETLEHQGPIPFYEENVNLEEEISTCDEKKNDANIEILNKDTYTNNDTLSEKDRKSSIQNNNQELNVLETVSKTNLDKQTTNLQKQNSFASEESHNTDDISLPDLPTTECTPISTTLNTPIHSDSEEPSGRVSSISSNPIEIIQNSPIISFTHSSIKIGSYEHLDDTVISKENTLLQFNLEEVNQSNNNSINAFENTIDPNNFNKSANASKSDVIEVCRNNKSQASSNKNSTIVNMKKLENREFNAKAPDICESSATEYETENEPMDLQKNSIQNSKNANIEKINNDRFQSATHPSKPINYKISIPIETSKSTLKNKLNENKQQHVINTVQNNDKHPEVNIETKKQSKCLFVNKLQQGTSNDKNTISGENVEEGHTIVRYVEKNTSSNVKNVLSIPNVNIYTSSADKLQNINTVSIPKRCLDMLTNNKVHSKSPQNLCINKEKDRESFSKDVQNKFKNQELTKNSDIDSSMNNSGSSNLEILSDHVTLHKTCSVSDTKNNSDMESNIINRKEDNELIFVKQGNSVSISKKVHDQSQKSDEPCKINTNVSQGNHNRNKILEKNKSELSQEDFNIDKVNMINNTQKQDFKEYMSASDDLLHLDKCIDNNSHIGNNYFNKRSTSQLTDTQFQQHYSAVEDTQALEKNTNVKNKVNSAHTPSSVTTICSITSEKSEQEQLYTVSKSFATKNVNSDFEIQVTNVNLKFTDNDICKELVSLRDKKQENLNNCSDGIKIEINVLCAERNAKEKLLQQESVNVDNEIMDQSNNSVYSSKSTCLGNLKEYNTLPHEKMDTEKKSNKIDEIIDHDQSQSTDIIFHENVENTIEEQEEPLSLIVRNKTLPTNKEGTLHQELSKGNETLSKDILNRSRNCTGDNNYTEVTQETKFTNTSNGRKKQHASLSLVDKPDDLKGESICYVKTNDLFNNINQENEPSNIIYSTTSANVNYVQNSANIERISKLNNAQKNKMKEPSSISHKYKDRKDEENDSSSEKNDDMPNIVTIHVKTDNMNNEKFAELDFTNFDLFSNESNKSNDNEPGKWRRPITPIVNQTLEECDLYGSTSGYVNPIFTNIEESNNRNEVPIYRTKDGKITYSPNPKALFLENKERAHCTKEEYSPHKYNHHLKIYKKEKDISNYKERIPLESNNTKIAWSESTQKGFSEFSNENDSQKNVHSMKHQRSQNLKHYRHKIEKKYNSITDNQVHKEYNKGLSVSKCEEQKEHGIENNRSTHKDSLTNEVVTDESESHEKNLKNIFDSNIHSKEKNIRKTEIFTGTTVANTVYHNTKNNNNIQKSSHNDTFSSHTSTNTFVEKISSTETCDIKSKYCDIIKESIVPYAICDQTVSECSLNQSNNLTSEKSNSIMKLEKKEFKPNLDRLKSSELCLEENGFKGRRYYTNSVMNHNSFSEDSDYFNEKKIDPNIIHIGTENICVDITKKPESQINSEISKYKRHYEHFPVKCEIDSDENTESFEAEFEDTRDILKYATTENILISKKDVLLTTTLDVECADSLKQLNNTKQKEKIEYQDESNGEIENTNFSLQNEISKSNEDENLNQQITEANIFYTDNNTTISEKGWRRLPSNCFKNDEIEIMESDIISHNNFDNEVNIIHGESMHMPQIKKSKMSKSIDESSFNEISNSDCQNNTFITTDHKYDTSFPEEEIKSEPIYIGQNKDEVVLLEPIISSKDIDVIEEINSNKDTEKKNIENTIPSLNSINNSKTENIINDENFSLNNINEIDVRGSLLKQKDIDVPRFKNYNVSDVINTSQDSLEVFNLKEKESQRKQFNDNLYCIENKISPSGSYLSSQELKSCSIEVCNTPELENISELNLEKNKNVINEITTNDINNKAEKERSLSPPDITTIAYINTNYSSTSDCNVNTQMISRSIIKENKTNTKSKPELSPQPKIPKMIIRNTGSCSTTSMAGDILETSSEYPSFVHNKVKHSTFIIENEKDNKERSDSDSEISLQKYDLNNSRVPKMKIKFNDKSLKRNNEYNNMEISFKRKDAKKIVPKVKIKKIRTEAATIQNDQTESSLIVMEVKTPDVSDEICSNKLSIINEERKREKIPKLKLKKHQEITSPTESIRKRTNLRTIDLTVKKYKSDKNEIKSNKKNEDIIRSTSKQKDNSSVSEHEIKNKLPCISEKIPKVIIKRASASAEFKCEFSEGGSHTIINSAKWQPEVKLQRSRLLDNMVKDLKYCHISKEYITRKCIDIISSHRTRKLIKSYGFRDKRHSKSNKLFRSSSISDLCPTKYEESRTLDYSYSNNKLSDTEATSILKGIEEHNEFSIKSISKYKFEKNPWNIEEKYIEESYISNDFVDRSSYKYSSDKDNMDYSIVKSDTTNIKNNTTLKSNVDNDLSTITFNANSTNNVSKMPLIIQKDFIHYNDSENKFPRENNESESKPLKSDITTDDSADNDCSVIKLDSSDESQSTIEILPASPDINQIGMEEHNNRLNNEEGEQLYSEDAIPTQFELELEVTDSNIDSVEVPPLRHELNSEHFNDTQLGTWQLNQKVQDLNDFQNYPQNYTNQQPILLADNGQQSSEVPEKNKISTKQNISLSITALTHDGSENHSTETTITSRENLCCNDLLMKEVLAAKEMLKKCLSMSKDATILKNKSKLKSLVEKNQGSCLTSSGHTKTFLKTITTHHTYETGKLNLQKSMNEVNMEKIEKKNSNELVNKVIQITKSTEKKDIKHIDVNVQNTLISAQNSPIISLKSLKRYSQSVPNKNMSTNMEHCKTLGDENERSISQDSHVHQIENKVQDIKIEQNMTYPKIEMISDNEDVQIEDDKSCNQSKKREDKMPVLEPEIAFSFDASSDRDSSRSPPVITNQEIVTTQNEVLKCLQGREELTSNDSTNDNKKYIAKEYDMTVTDIVTQLAYHKKSTIRHKRYCNLCEKWFPTTSRHRRHLAGYQHRHLELTQRRTIHALFILFTGKPCSKLLRATSMRDDCSIGEPTPLQIAVQDLAKYLDGTETNLLIPNNVEK